MKIKDYFKGKSLCRLNDYFKRKVYEVWWLTLKEKIYED